jgi:catalase (peroxidase I)
MPIMVRLAWHDAGTFNAADNTGGANASIRFQPEVGHGANAGLTWAIEQLQVCVCVCVCVCIFVDENCGGRE